MDNIITGFIGVAIFLAFVGGLAQSIGALPFVIIVAVIGGMALYDYYESVRDARREAAENADNGAAATPES